MTSPPGGDRPVGLSQTDAADPAETDPAETDPDRPLPERLLVVAVHGALYWRLNRNIIRVFPFNLASALLVVAAGAAGISGGAETAAGYAIVAAALVVGRRPADTVDP
jgi:hypothetical protein